ncbi:MAG: hypothetical protein ACI9BD_000528 [Candidatus Marinamargulisbacteria bacterium]
MGVNKDMLMVRVGPDNYQDYLSKEHTSKMDFTGRTMKGFLYVSMDGIETLEGLTFWVTQAHAFVIEKILKP